MRDARSRGEVGHEEALGGMIVRRLIREFVGLVGLALVVAPLVALAAVSMVDREPGGPPRWTSVPAALALFDPVVRASLTHGFLVAAFVAAASVLLGVMTARATTMARFWGRPVLLLLATLPAACPPVAGALGLHRLMSSGVSGGAWNGLPLRWACLVWVELAYATPWVAWQVRATLRAIEPGWLEGARAAGLGHRATWFRLVWPVVRPTAAHAAASVFVVVLLEPGGPLILGLRQTVGRQIVEGCWLGDPAGLARASVLALVSLGVAALIRRSILAWGGTPILVEKNPVDLPPRPSSPLDSSSARALGRTPWLTIVPLIGWIALALAPLLGLLLPSISSTTPVPDQGWLAWLPLLLDSLVDPALAGALTLGLSILPLAALLGWGMDRSRAGRWARGILRTMPPLSHGTGVLVLPMFWELIAGGWGWSGSGSEGSMSSGPPPWPFCLIALSILNAPWFHVALREAHAATPRPLFEIARSLGAARWRIAWSIGRPLAGPSLAVGASILVLLSISNLAPALILSPRLDRQPLGPSLLDRFEQPSGLDSAQGIALLIVLASLASLPGLLAWQGHRDAGLPRL